MLPVLRTRHKLWSLAIVPALPLLATCATLTVLRISGIYGGNHKSETSYVRGPKTHINFFNIKKVYVPHFLGKGAKRTHINFLGWIFGVKKGAPNGAFSATKSLVYCFFPALVCFRHAEILIYEICRTVRKDWSLTAPPFLDFWTCCYDDFSQQIRI